MINKVLINKLKTFSRDAEITVCVEDEDGNFHYGFVREIVDISNETAIGNSVQIVCVNIFDADC